MGTWDSKAHLHYIGELEDWIGLGLGDLQLCTWRTWNGDFRTGPLGTGTFALRRNRNLGLDLEDL